MLRQPRDHFFRPMCSGVIFWGMTDSADSTTDVWTVNRLLRWTGQFLASGGIDDSRLCAEILLSHVLGWSKIDLYARFEYEPTAEERTSFRELVKKAAAQHPIAYLVGQKEFYSLPFEVTPDVLIPRPETEALVEQAIELLRRREAEHPCFVDMGTGSGCIAVAILSQVPSAQAVASDISAAALAVAQRNAERNQVDDRITFVEADRLKLPDACIPDGGFELIVSNPPYIGENQMGALPATVRQYEPESALVAGPNGLAFYTAIHDAAPMLLKPAGAVLLEIGAGMSEAVRRTMEESGLFRHDGTFRDAADLHERVLRFSVTTPPAPGEK